MADHMFFESVLGRHSLVAKFAVISDTIVIFLHMFVVVASSTESFTTQFTMKRILPGVYLQVLLQMTFVTEVLETNKTLKFTSFVRFYFVHSGGSVYCARACSLHLRFCHLATETIWDYQNNIYAQGGRTIYGQLACHKIKVPTNITVPFFSTTSKFQQI